MNQQNLNNNGKLYSNQNTIKMNAAQAQCDCNEISVVACQNYPPIAVERANFTYARMLYQPLAGEKSEMTVIYQYLYQNWFLKEKHPKLSDLLFRIAKVQMNHLNILGELVVLLGGNPKCRVIGKCCAAHNHNTLQFWNGSMIKYDCKVKDMLQNNCLIESGACNTYQTLSKLIHDPCVSEVLSCFAMDEQLHAKLFQQEIENLCT